MEIPREADALSMTGSIDNFSTYSQSTERKVEKNILENHSDLSLIAEALNEIMAESNARNREIAELLGQLDIETKPMPKVIQETFAKVSAVLRTEGLPEVDEIALTIQMEDKRRESNRIAYEKRKLKSRYDELCKGHSGVLQKLNKARESTESLQQYLEMASMNHEEEYANRIFMGTKLNDYRQTADKIQESLPASNDFYPEKILEKYDDCLKLEEELRALDKSLSEYGDLSTNLSEAKTKIEEMEKYIKDLDHTLFPKMK